MKAALSLCAGSTDTYYRSSTGKRFRSIKAALEHMIEPGARVTSPKKEPVASPGPDRHSSGKGQKSPSPTRHHTSKLIIRGSMLKPSPTPEQAAPAPAGSENPAQEAVKEDEAHPAGTAQLAPMFSAGFEGPTSPGKNFGSMSALLNSPKNSAPEAQQKSAQKPCGDKGPKAVTSGRAAASAAQRATASAPTADADASKNVADSQPADNSFKGAVSRQEAADQEKAHAEPNGENPGTQAEDKTKGDQEALTVKTQPGSSRRKRKRENLALHTAAAYKSLQLHISPCFK